MSWFSRKKAPKPSAGEKERLQLPGGLWTKCLGCSEVIYSQDLLRNASVCPKCSYHFRMSARDRISLLTDRHSFEERYGDLKTNDPLSFRDSQRYKDRLTRAEKRSQSSEAVVTGKARISGIEVALGVFDFAFMGGSMGVVVGEKLARIVEDACKDRHPVLIVSCSGGARMQEGLFSLMQMAKVSAAIARLSAASLPYISVLSDPTTGGVAASFAMLGDIIVAEPGALIGFAGPRVIEQTIQQQLPEGFQRSEFLLEHGMVDLISPRAQLKDNLARILGVLAA